MNTTQTTITLAPISNNDGLNVNLAPSDMRTVAILPSNTPAVSVTFFVNTQSCLIGDELIIIARCDTPPNLIFNLVNKIGLTGCGTFTEMQGGFTPDATWAGHFWFDGTAFINNYDNC